MAHSEHELSLSHVRYFIDASVPIDVRQKLGELLEAFSAQPCNLQPLSSDSDDNPVGDEGDDNDDDVSRGKGKGSSATRLSSKFDVDDVTHIITLSPTYWGHNLVRDYNQRILDEYESATSSGAPSSYTVNTSAPPLPSTAPTSDGKRGLLIAEVTPKWLTRTVDLKKRQEEQFFSPDPQKVFSGVVVCTEDLPLGDSETIKGVVAALGGQSRQALMIEVTHLVCTKPSGKKYDRLMQSGWKLGMRAILPHWIDDCIRLRARVPEDEYLFPDPPLLATTIGKSKPYLERLQQSLNLADPVNLPSFTSALVDPRQNSDRDTTNYLESLGKRVSPESTKVNQKLLGGKKVYIADNCDLTLERRTMYRDLIRSAGGKLLSGKNAREKLAALERTDYAIINYREGWEYWKAYQMKKIIGNLDWLVYVLFQPGSTTTKRTPPSQDSVVLPSPMDRLLHHPWPRYSAGGFPSHILTISSYSGAARESLKRMIEYLGGKFEGNMTKHRTTHVVSYAESGDKVKHARQWGIPVVNHRWVEDSFIAWSDVPTNRSQYCDNSESVPNRSADNSKGPSTTVANMVGTRDLPPAAIEVWAATEPATTDRVQSMKILEDELRRVEDAISSMNGQATRESSEQGEPKETSPSTSRQPHVARRTGQLQPLAKPSSMLNVQASVETLPAQPSSPSTMQSPSSPHADSKAPPEESVRNLENVRPSASFASKDTNGVRQNSEDTVTPGNTATLQDTHAPQDMTTYDGHDTEMLDADQQQDFPTPASATNHRDEDKAIEDALIEKPRPRPLAKRRGKKVTPPPIGTQDTEDSQTPPPDLPLSKKTSIDSEPPSSSLPSINPDTAQPYAAPVADDEEHEDDEDTPEPAPPPPTTETTKTTAKPAAKRKRAPAAREITDWSPIRIGSARKAAVNAAQKLHDEIMPDVLAFAKELKGGGKRRLDEQFGAAGVPSSASPAKKRASSANNVDVGDSSEDEAADARNTPNGRAPPPKKHVRIDEPVTGPRPTKGRAGRPKKLAQSTSQISSEISSFDAPPGKKHRLQLPKSKVVIAGNQVKIASTGVQLDDGLRKQLVRLGASLLEDKADGCTHIIVKSISRTVKFLCALAGGAYFVTEQWAIDSVNQNQFLDEDKYMLRDKEGEARHEVHLAKSLATARRTKVFEEQIFYITPKVVPDFEALKAIAEAGGAAKVVKKLPTLKLVQDKADVHVISSPDEAGNWENLAMNGVPVYSGEAIIKAVLQQEMNFDLYQLND